MRRFAVLLSLAALAACSGANQSQSQATAPPSAAASTLPTVSSAITAPPATVAPTATPTPGPLATVHYTDTRGTYAENQIRTEAAAGVFESKSGKFNPYGTLTRAQYVRWLVKSNNAMFKTDQSRQIRLADPSSDQTFSDVPKSNPDYAYIQGMANAGYVIGVDNKHFAPNRTITREELLAIYVSRCVGPIKPASESQMESDTGLTDAASVAKPYWGALDADHFSGLFGSNGALTRIFGSIKTLHPQKPATRSEAALSIYTIQSYSIDRALAP